MVHISYEYSPHIRSFPQTVCPSLRPQRLSPSRPQPPSFTASSLRPSQAARCTPGSPSGPTRSPLPTCRPSFGAGVGGGGALAGVAQWGWHGDGEGMRRPLTASSPPRPSVICPPCALPIPLASSVASSQERAPAAGLRALPRRRRPWARVTDTRGGEGGGVGLIVWFPACLCLCECLCVCVCVCGCVWVCGCVCVFDGGGCPPPGPHRLPCDPPTVGEFRLCRPPHWQEAPGTAVMDHRDHRPLEGGTPQNGTCGA